MKKNFLRIIFIFFISFVLYGEDEKYTFIPQEPNKGYSWKENIIAESFFDLPGIGMVHEVNKFTTLEEYMGEEDGYTIIKKTRTNIETDYRIGNIEDVPHSYLAMQDAPCLVYINKDGWDDHVKPVNPEHDYLEDTFEAAYIHNTSFTNWYYPFGENAINLSVGDKWYSKNDSLRRFVNDDSPESLFWSEITYTLKKIKKKKGKTIAIIDIKSDVRSDLNVILFLRGERVFLTGEAWGTFETTIKVYVETLALYSIKEYGNLAGDLEMDGEKFRTKFTFKNFANQVK